MAKPAHIPVSRRISFSRRSIAIAAIVLLSLAGAGCASSASAQTEKGPSSAPGQNVVPDQGVSEYLAIASTLQKYLDAARTGDGNSQRSIWFDHAHVVGSEDGQFTNTDPDDFAQAVSRGGAAPQVVGRIVDITVSGPAASARIEIQDWGGFRYTDFMLLYKRDGVWRVSGKVYDSHDRN